MLSTPCAGFFCRFGINGAEQRVPMCHTKNVICSLVQLVGEVNGRSICFGLGFFRQDFLRAGLARPRDCLLCPVGSTTVRNLLKIRVAQPVAFRHSD